MDQRTEFRRIYDDHRDALFAYFVSRAPERDSAADLTQELFLRAWRHLSELLARNSDGQRAWLFTVARNLTVDESRRRRTQAGMRAALRREPQRVAPSAADPTLSDETVATVGRAVAALPRELRTVLTLAAASDLTSAQIGRALGLPAGTVRYRLSRARAAVTAAMATGDLVDATDQPTPTTEGTPP